MSALNRVAITILTYPLKALEEDEAQAISKLSGARPIVLNSEKLQEDPDVIQWVADGCYTHIY